MEQTIKVVVARYNENLNWVEPIKDRCIIYNKGLDDIPYEYTKLANVGREVETYLKYIISHYYDLPDFVAFTQGGICDHLSNLCTFYMAILSIERGWEVPSGYLGLNERSGDMGWTEINDFFNPNHPDLPLQDFGQKIYKIDPEDNTILCNFCGVFIVSRDNIHFNSLSFYKKLYILLMENPDTNMYIMERLWTTIFNKAYRGQTKE